MNTPDPEMEKLLAKPEFLSDPVFSKDQYLTQVAHGMFGHFLRLAKVPPEAFKQVQQAYADSNSICLKFATLVAWTYELEAKGPDGKTGSDLFIARAKLPVAGAAAVPSGGIQECVIGRRVVRIQVESAAHPPTSKEYQVCDVKNVGWYGAILILPNQIPPGNERQGTVEQKKTWWKFW